MGTVRFDRANGALAGATWRTTVIAETQTGNNWMVLVTGEETGERVAIAEACLGHGTESPRLIHSREDVYIYVLDGRLTIERDGERFDRAAGSGLLLPRGSEHTLTVESPAARLLLAISPAGLERCLGELEELEHAGSSELHVERLVALAARFGVAITGPARAS